MQSFFLSFFRRIIDLNDATFNGRSEVSGGDMTGACRSNLQVAVQFWTNISIINRLGLHHHDHCGACNRLRFVRSRATPQGIIRILRRRTCVILTPVS